MFNLQGKESVFSDIVVVLDAVSIDASTSSFIMIVLDVIPK